MRIAFVLCSAPDVSIPPQAYGGIQLGIHNYCRILEGLGHEVRVVNDVVDGASIPRRIKIIRAVNSFRPDLVHIKNPRYFNLSRWFRCRGVFLSDHSAEVCNSNYPHRRALHKNTHLICLSERIRQHYLSAGASAESAHTIPNGLTVEKFRFTATPRYQDRSIYLAIVNHRKRQYLFHGIPGLDFVGPAEDGVALSETYLGEWSRRQVEEK